MTHHNNFEMGKQYGRCDGKIVKVVGRWQYKISATGDYGALVTGDDGIERWDDPSPGFGLCTSNLDPMMNLMVGEIPVGKTHTGPLKIR